MPGKTSIWQIGLDDTDSKDGMCTTYLGAVILDDLKMAGAKAVGQPKLIRLNPGCPFKTRGNCSVALAVEVPEQYIQKVKLMVLEKVKEHAELRAENTDPGVVFFRGGKIPPQLSEFSKRVVQEIVTIEDAEEIARKTGAEVHKFKLGRGIIGALAAIGNTLDSDQTYELIAYRIPENRGSPRKIDPASVVEMNEKTFPGTFDNIDPRTGEIRITPHSPCPILYGIRGEKVEAVTNAQRMVKAFEPIERSVVFRTNQGTDEHLRQMKISEIEPYFSASVKGRVSSSPKIIRGGHVILKVRDDTGEVDCAAYEPTRQFREVVKRLIPGDSIVVKGGAKKRPGLPLTINLEKLEILDLAPKILRMNPRCKECGKRMKSEGRGKGYSCEKCGSKSPPGSSEISKIDREIGAGKFEVPPRARRHLSRPLVRELHVKPTPREL